MDYDEVNNCMTEQQKNSLKTAALQQLLQKVVGGAQEYTSYDDVNNQLTEQQKNSYQTAALQQLAEADIGGVLLHSKISDLTDSSGYSIYADPDRTTPLTRNELSELLFGIFSDGEGGMVANKVPKSAWLYSDDSLEAIYKVLGGFYDDMSSGFLMAGLGSNKLAFYRVYNDPSDGDTIFRAEKLTSLS